MSGIFKLKMGFLQLIITGCMLCNSCISISESGKIDMWIEFQKNKSKWNQQHIHDYQFVLERSCFCLPFEITYPTRIIVRNDEISEVEIIPSQKRVPDEDFGSYFTLGRLFDYLEEDIINKVDIITVKYDSLYGFPQYIFVDEDTLAYDDEIEIVIKEFRKLN